MLHVHSGLLLVCLQGAGYWMVLFSVVKFSFALHLHPVLPQFALKLFEVLPNIVVVINYILKLVHPQGFQMAT